MTARLRRLAAATLAMLAAGLLAACAPAGPTPPPTITRNAATQLLAGLSDAANGPLTGYNRDQFGPAWSDDVTVPGGHNGCRTRDDILTRDLTGAQHADRKHRCKVTSGTLLDPYTGRTLILDNPAAVSSVQIDHMYPLAAAWMHGAAAWSPLQRRNFANDPLNLRAVTGSVNESKGDQTPGTWMPPNRGDQCAYATQFVQVAAAYKLTITTGDRQVLLRALNACPPPGSPA